MYQSNAWPVDVARLLPWLRGSHNHHDALAWCADWPAFDQLDGTRTRSAWRPALQDKPNRKDGAMKLTSAQVERTMSQFEVQALPDNHPAVPELNELFGEHTFLLDSNGLNILEPAEESPGGGVQAARVVNLANWSGDNLTKLAPHEPQPTGAIVELPMSRH